MVKGGALAAEAMELCRPVVEALSEGLVLAGLSFCQEEGEQVLRLILDSSHPISLEDCEAVTEAVNPVLDQQFSWQQPYNLEVCSWGYERPLEDTAALLRHRGELLRLRLAQPREGRHEIQAYLLDADEERLRLRQKLDVKALKGRRISEKKRAELEQEFELERGAVREIRREVDFG